MMRRRTFVAGMAASLMAPPLAAAYDGRVYRVGFLSAEPPPTPVVPAIGLESLRKALRDLGYTEGHNLQFQYRWISGSYSRLPEAIRDLLAANVDAIVTWATPLVVAIQRESRTVPIVCALCTDLVKGGAVSSLAKPDTNATGLTAIGPELMAKRLEILNELGASRVVVVHPLAHDHPISSAWLAEADRAARALSMKVEEAPATETDAVERRFATAAREPRTACMVMESPRYLAARHSIGEWALRHRVATMFMFRQHVTHGGLVSYGVNIDTFFRRAATYVDRLLKGAAPADLPVEQPTHIELVINARTAKTLAMSIPQSLLLRADEVIQ